MEVRSAVGFRRAAGIAVLLAVFSGCVTGAEEPASGEAAIEAALDQARADADSKLIDRIEEAHKADDRRALTPEEQAQFDEALKKQGIARAEVESALRKIEADSPNDPSKAAAFVQQLQGPIEAAIATLPDDLAARVREATGPSGPINFNNISYAVNPFRGVDPDVMCQERFEEDNPGIARGDRTGASLPRCAAGSSGPDCVRTGIIPRRCGRIDVNVNHLRQPYSEYPQLRDLDRWLVQEFTGIEATASQPTRRIFGTAPVQLPSSALFARVRLIPNRHEHLSGGRSLLAPRFEGDALPAPNSPVLYLSACRASGGWAGVFGGGYGRADAFATLRVASVTESTATGVPVFSVNLDTTTVSQCHAATAVPSSTQYASLGAIESWITLPARGDRKYVNVDLDAVASVYSRGSGSGVVYHGNNAWFGTEEEQRADFEEMERTGLPPRNTHVVIDWYGYITPVL